MACGGPSQDYAYERADAAYAEVLFLLKEKYDADRPHILKGRLNGKDVEIGFGKKNAAEWDEQCKQLHELLREMVWNSDASSW